MCQIIFRGLNDHPPLKSCCSAFRGFHFLKEHSGGSCHLVAAGCRHLKSVKSLMAGIAPAIAVSRKRSRFPGIQNRLRAVFRLFFTKNDR